MMAVFFLKTSLILLMAALAMAVMRRSSAASRHVVWTTAMLAVLLLPIASALVPSIRLPILRPTVALAPPEAPIDLRPRAVVYAPTITRPAAVEQAAAAPAQAPADRALPRLELLWFVGSAALLIRFARGYQARRRLSLRSEACVDASILERVAALSRHMGISRSVSVWIAPAEMMPATWGVARPSLLLPPSACEWTDERLSLVLTHELAHVLRFDAVAHGVAQAAVVLVWWNPLVWVASARAQLERERACDDAVLRNGIAASVYADALLAVAETFPSPFVHRLTLAMARPHRIERRLSSILDPAQRRTGTSHLCASLTSIVLAAQLPLAAAHLESAQFVPAELPEVQTFQALDPQVSALADYVASLERTTRSRIDASVSAHFPQPALAGFNGSWEPLPADAARLATLFEVGMAPIRGCFTVEQAGETVTVSQTVPDDILRAYIQINRRDITRVVYTTFEWNSTFRLESDELVAQFRAKTPIHFRRAQSGAAATPASPMPIPAGQFGAGAYRPGNGVANPIRIREVKPVYTPAADRAGIQGIVELEAIIGTDGTVTDVRVVRSLDKQYGLDDNAMDSVRRTPFMPCKLNTQPVPCVVVFELQFTLAPPTPIPAGQFGAGAYRFRQGAGMEAPIRTHEVRPQYTPEAMRAKIQGSVLLEFVVNVDGTVGDVHVVRPLDKVFGLDEQAVMAVKATRWQPGRFNNAPVPMVIVTDLAFTLR